MKTESIALDGVTLAVRIDGEAGRPWLVVLNSLGADGRMWDDQMPLLTRTHRVLRIDTRGHGGSDTPAGEYDFAMLVADVTGVMDRLGIERADILGLSLGGMTALGLGLAQPQRVGRMIVCDARANATPPFVAGWDDRIAAIRKGGMEAVLEGTLDRWFTPDVDPAVRARAREMLLATSPEGYIGCACALKRLGYLRALGKLSMPVLYVVGEHDAGAPRAAMQDMAARTPQSAFHVIPGMAHVPNMEAPGAFEAAVAGWLREGAAVALAGSEA